ncbi:hypothetical protein L2E82_18017 [Cichorium intybus]|uniref:Uncharacterized protein n=1 Tax=Cichorium intybus TaxID=13427 RepID=A0ACB9F964_CICIN|nr:hypothetical protein L2E82_18017 [Cichorium intybus]
MAGGHYITRLAQSYGLLTAATVATLTTIPRVRTSARFLENMGLIHQPQAGRYLRVATEAPRVPRPTHVQEEGPARRRRIVADPPVEDQPQPQLSDVLTDVRDLDLRVSHIEAHNRWMAKT